MTDRIKKVWTKLVKLNKDIIIEENRNLWAVVKLCTNFGKLQQASAALTYHTLFAIVPVMVTAFIAGKFFKTDYADNIGMLCGAMANPFALDYADPSGEGEDPAVAYATVYPASIFLRVISVQIIMLIFL